MNAKSLAAFAAFAAFATPLAAVADTVAPPVATETPAPSLFAQFTADKDKLGLVDESLTAPAVAADPNALPEGNTWRYSEAGLLTNPLSLIPADPCVLGTAQVFTRISSPAEGRSYGSGLLQQT